MSDSVRIEDFYHMPWTMYQDIIDRLTEQISRYSLERDIEFDLLVPIMRGGGVPSVSLSHSLGIAHIYPIQYKYVYGDEDGAPEYKTEKLMSSIEALDPDCEHTILVTEGNHCTGQTAQLCINEILKLLPQAKIYYASIGRDASSSDGLVGTEKEWCGIYTNELKTLTDGQCKEQGILNKYIVYPWENLEEEYMEVVMHNKCDENAGGQL